MILSTAPEPNLMSYLASSIESDVLSRGKRLFFLSNPVSFDKKKLFHDGKSIVNMAPKYKLVYFNARGRAELARFILAQAAVDYDDTRLEKDKWPAYKPSTPYGQLPVLEFDGKKLAQSYAICRYLAKNHDLIPKDSYEEALSDSVVNACIDVMDKVAPWARETDAQKKAELGAIFLTEVLPKQLEFLEKFIKAHGKGYLIGDKLSWADLAVAGALHTLRDKVPTALDAHPLIKAELEKVVNLPNIKAWIAKRPVTEH